MAAKRKRGTGERMATRSHKETRKGMRGGNGREEAQKAQKGSGTIDP